MAGRADEMKMARMAIGGLEPRSSFPEIDFARDAGVDHPLQRAVDGGAANSGILAMYEVAEIVRAQMPFAAQKDIEDAIALARPLPARRPKTRDVRNGRRQPTQLPNSLLDAE